MIEFAPPRQLNRYVAVVAVPPKDEYVETMIGKIDRTLLQFDKKIACRSKQFKGVTQCEHPIGLTADLRLFAVYSNRVAVSVAQTVAIRLPLPSKISPVPVAL